MKRNVVEMVLGAVVLIIAAGFLVFSYSAADLKSKDGYEVSATFTEIGSLSIGSDVRMSGVKIGSVADLKLDPQSYLAQVVMSIDTSVELPEDSSAIITSEGLMGGNFVALQPGGAEEFLKEGGKIEYTQDAQNLEKLLGQFIFSIQDNKDDNKS